MNKLRKVLWFVGYWIWPFQVLWGKEYDAALTFCLREVGYNSFASASLRAQHLNKIAEYKVWAKDQRPAVRRAYNGWLSYYERDIHRLNRDDERQRRCEAYERSGKFPVPNPRS